MAQALLDKLHRDCTVADFGQNTQINAGVPSGRIDAAPQLILHWRGNQWQTTNISPFGRLIAMGRTRRPSSNKGSVANGLTRTSRASVCGLISKPMSICPKLSACSISCETPSCNMI